MVQLLVRVLRRPLRELPNPLLGLLQLRLALELQFMLVLPEPTDGEARVVQRRDVLLHGSRHRHLVLAPFASERTRLRVVLPSKRRRLMLLLFVSSAALVLGGVVRGDRVTFIVTVAAVLAFASGVLTVWTA